MSRSTLNEAYARYFPVIRERCRRLLGDGEDAADVAQETFIRFWQLSEHGSPQAPRTIAAWIHRTSTHLAIDHLRARGETVEVPETLMAHGHDVGAMLDNRRHLQALVQRVPADALEAGVLTRVSGLSHQEAALHMNVSERTLRRLLTKLETALARLRGELLS